ncbi:hypothetical protein NEAUS03_0195 [Nematocida ausubeli]|nr:hypothetical protein NEAUS03_0195 [Nematocida ausubeli]
MLSILLRFNADINIANVLAAYARIYWSSDKMCIAKIVQNLPTQKDRILKCLNQYMAVKCKNIEKRKIIIWYKLRMNLKPEDAAEYDNLKIIYLLAA